MDHLSAAMLSYTGLTAFTCVFLVATGVLIASSNMLGTRGKRAFVSVTGILFVLAFLDWFGNFTAGNPAMATWHSVSTAVVFSLAPILPVTIAYAIIPDNRARLLAAPLAANVMLQIESVLHEGLVFWVTPDNVYQRGPYYLLYVFVYALCALFLVEESVRAGRKFQSRNHLAMAGIVVTMFFGVFLQLAIPAVQTTWTAVAVAVLMYFVYTCEMYQQTDGLTSLLNRRTYELFCESPQLPAQLMFFDVDDFKHVNDTYGHAVGDECLCNVANAMRRTFGKHALCYRIGGDEFCAVLTRRIEDAAAFKAQFEQAIEQMRSQDERMPGVSVGMAYAQGDATSLAAAIAEADKAMYTEKIIRKGKRHE